MNDISRGKFSIYCNGKWLNSVESTEKIETLINNLQQYISNLHHIHNSCKDMYNKYTDDDTYLKLLEKVFQGKEVRSKVIKLILSSYNK